MMDPASLIAGIMIGIVATLLAKCVNLVRLAKSIPDDYPHELGEWEP